MKKTFLLPVAMIGFALPAQAATVVSYNDTGGTLPTVLNNDLVNGLTPIVVGTGSLWTGNQNWAWEGVTGASAVNDGSASGFATVGGHPAGVNRANTGNAGGLDLIWNFASTVDLSTISMHFGWGGGREDVAIRVFTSATPYVLTSGPYPDGFFSTSAVDAGIAANGGFTELATAATVSNNNISVLIASDNANPLVTNVRSLYIQFGAAENGYAGLREIDVTGAVAVPEPSAALLGGLGVLALLRRRRA